MDDDALIAAMILAAVALAEGIRRLPIESHVLRRLPFGSWKHAKPPQIAPGTLLISWCLPLSVPLVLSGASLPSPLSVRRLLARREARDRRTRVGRAFLRALGVLIILVLVVGLPFAAATRGARGFLVAAVVLVELSLVQAVVTWLTLRDAGASRRSALHLAFPLLWPFTALRAPEIVEARVVDGVPRMPLLQALLGQRELLRIIRPKVYDLLAGDVRDAEATALLEMCGRETLAAFIREAPAHSADEAWCPRCATLYRAEVSACSDCSVALSAGHSPQPAV